MPGQVGDFAIAGTTSVLHLIMVDTDGIGLGEGGAMVSAHVWEGPSFAPASIIDHSNGSVSVHFRLDIQGTYQASPPCLVIVVMYADSKICFGSAPSQAVQQKEGRRCMPIACVQCCLQLMSWYEEIPGHRSTPFPFPPY